MADIYTKLQESKRIKEDALSRSEPLLMQAQAMYEAGDPIGAIELANQAKPDNLLAETANADYLKYRDELKGLIASGDILSQPVYGGVIAPPVTEMDQVKEGYQRAISEYLGAPIDMNSEAGWSLRSKLAFLQPENKRNYLIQNLGEDNVVTINVGGSPTNFIKNQDGSLFPVDDFDFTAKDFMDAAGEVFPIISSAAGGIGGGALFKTPIGVASGSAAAYIAAGSFQDALFAKVFGVQDFGKAIDEALPRRGFEAAIGMPLEYGMTKALAAPIRQGVRIKAGQAPKVEQEINEVGAFLARKGITDVDGLVRIMEANPTVREKLLRAADRFPQSELGLDVRRGANRIAIFKDETIPKGQLGEELYKDAANRINQQQDSLVQYLSLHDSKLAGQLQSQRMGAVAATRASTDPFNQTPRQILNRPVTTQDQAGEFLKSFIGKGKEVAEQAKNAVYEPFYAKANALVSVDPVDFAKAIEMDFYKKQSRPASVQRFIDDLYERPRNAARRKELQEKITDANLPESTRLSYQREIDRLEQISGPLNATQLDEQFRILRNLGEDGQLAGVGAPETKIASTNAARIAQEFRDSVYRNTIDPETGQPLLREWQNATAKYQEFLDYTQPGLKSDIVSVIGADPRLTNREAVARVIKDPEDIRSVLSVVGRDTPENLPQLQSALQDVYLQKIGLAGKELGGTTSFEFDPGIVRELWGAGNPQRGELMVRKMGQLQEKFQKLDLKPTNVTADDLNNLNGALSQRSVDQLLETISQREIAAREIKRRTHDILLKDALNGHKTAIHFREYPEALFDAPTDKVKRIFSKFGTNDQKTMRQDYAEHLFSLYPGNPDTTIGRLELFNGPKLLADIRKRPQIERNMRLIMGDKDVDQLLAYAKLIPATTDIRSTQRASISGVTTFDGGTPGLKLFGQVKPLWEYGTDKVTALMYRGGTLFPTLRELSRKELTQDQAEKVLTASLIAPFMGAKGIDAGQAVFETGRHDPEWSYQMGKTFGTLSREAQEFYREYGAAKSPRTK